MTSLYCIHSKMKTALLLVLFVFSAGVIRAQEQPVSGVVVDSQTGEPIIGATVIVDGTNLVAITDANGAFSLNAARGASLSITYLGYENGKATVTGTAINVPLTQFYFK